MELRVKEAEERYRTEMTDMKKNLPADEVQAEEKESEPDRLTTLDEMDPAPQIDGTPTEETETGLGEMEDGLAPEAAARETGVPSDEPIEVRYQRAMADLENHRYVEARTGFTAIVAQHPNHTLAPNALYWQGEAEYDLNNYNQAILVFQKVVETYPESSKVPDALLKMGRSRERLGQLDEAREEYRRVIDRYPKSRAAKLAREWL